MSPRTLAFVSAAVMLVVVRFAMLMKRKRGSASLDPEPRTTVMWNPWQLVLASFLTLFAELAFIRWISVEVWIFAYFKNLALLLCFLGFGVGCALAARDIRWASSIKAFLGLLLLVRIPWGDRGLLESVSMALGSTRDVGVWGTPAPEAIGWLSFVAAIGVAACIFVLIALIFIPLGQVVGAQIDQASSSLHAYSLNLLGSLIGVIVFFVLSSWMLPPVVWMGAVMVGFAALQPRRRDAAVVAALLMPLAFIVYDPGRPGTQIRWTPYQQIQYTREYTQNGEVLGGLLQINHTFYQETLDLSPQFLARHPELGSASDFDRYNLPFRFAVSSPKVLVVGSGTGNDVAGALRHGASSVDAVEIDPAIIALGRREHPEKPYSSSLVTIHQGDARNFLRRTNHKYDLILFGLLDSHVQFSDYANMRIDNYVYTEEAFRDAAQLLTPDGVIFVKFRVERPWLGMRLREILSQSLQSAPLVFLANPDYSGGATCFVSSRGNRVNQALSSDSALASFVQANPAHLSRQPVPITTDDWPYLYQQDRRIPKTYFAVGLLVILIAIVFYLRVARATETPAGLSLFFFSMGAGFLLLETQIISRLALYFGTIWQVNGIVISAVLIALLLANLVVEKIQVVPKLLMWAALVLTLAFAYAFPFDRIAATPRVVGTIAIAVFSLPVFFAGILFSSEFKRTTSPSSALNANVLGAVAGGLLENLSLVYGLRALLLLAIVLYCVAGVGLWRLWKRPVERAATVGS
jgi:spermidine synthase